MSKKAVFVIAQEGFRDEELLKTKDLLQDREIETVVAAPGLEKAIGKHGSEVEPNLSWADISSGDFDAIIFIGGPGMSQYLESEQTINLAKDFSQAGKIIGAICVTPSILANAGLLIGRRVTGYPTEQENMVNKGAEYTGMPVEVDGKIVTGKDHSAAIEFGEKIAWELGA